MTKTKKDLSALYLLIATLMIGAVLWIYGEVKIVKATEPISPRGENVLIQPEAVGGAESHAPAAKPEFTTDDMSAFISQAVQEFLPTHKSESLMIMHCLAHRENGHAANRNCGDSGLACGPFQFHQDTWVRMRKAMIRQGVATEVGDRYDKKESARTTTWAIQESSKPKKDRSGSITEWGPIARELQGSDYAVCQYPSWLPKEGN